MRVAIAQLHAVPLHVRGNAERAAAAIADAKDGDALIGPLDGESEELARVSLDLAEARDARGRSVDISPRRDRRTDVYTPLLGCVASSSAAWPAQRGPQAASITSSRLAEMRETRGYSLEIHEILATWDPQFLRDYAAFLDATFVHNNTLDRRTRELVYVGTLTALGLRREDLVAHLRVASANGATPAQLLAVLKRVLPPAGVPRFIEPMTAFRDVCGDAPIMETPL